MGISLGIVHQFCAIAKEVHPAFDTYLDVDQTSLLQLHFGRTTNKGSCLSQNNLCFLLSSCSWATSRKKISSQWLSSGDALSEIYTLAETTEQLEKLSITVEGIEIILCFFWCEDNKYRLLKVILFTSEFSFIKKKLL